MKLRAVLKLHEPIPLGELESWLVQLRQGGMSDNAQAKVGKTTGQQFVLIVSEEKNEQNPQSPHALS